MAQYKSAWAEADHFAGLIRAALIRAGLSEDDASRVRGLVTGTGCVYVELGTFRVGAATKLLEALPLARVAPENSDGPKLPAQHRSGCENPHADRKSLD
ncbi:hypothetical protein [Streptomyces sp. H27-D2]|uniref:hypothetical protein n=1 Tax=Streptomyces sp. H27-D2 TaxID=3046304 RepID=UPI002DB9C353|nr:hypothetical protein [Streptomyces sp. H27-D2]MEC4015160.1 hypothetical protein [Streptomyces sp. H27-D2]